MAKDASFDIVSEYDKQELANAVDQVKRDIAARFDLKDSNSEVVLDLEKSITVTTSDETKLRNIYDILQSKIIKRGLSIKILDPQKPEDALGGKVRQVYNLRKGLNTEKPYWTYKDDLQAVIALIRENADKYDYPLQFQNYR